MEKMAPRAFSFLLAEWPAGIGADWKGYDTIDLEHVAIYNAHSRCCASGSEISTCARRIDQWIRI